MLDQFTQQAPLFRTANQLIEKQEVKFKDYLVQKKVMFCFQLSSFSQTLIWFKVIGYQQQIE